jgi:hypothetical protein
MANCHAGFGVGDREGEASAFALPPLLPTHPSLALLNAGVGRKRTDSGHVRICRQFLSHDSVCLMHVAKHYTAMCWRRQRSRRERQRSGHASIIDEILGHKGFLQLLNAL